MRPVKTVPAGPHHAVLAYHLQELRQRAGLTFAELAQRTAVLGNPDLAVSAATLKRAAGCRSLPKQNTVLAYARGCGATPQEERKALHLWARARARGRGILHQLRPPAVHNIRTRREFTSALAAVYETIGAPPLRTVQQRAGTVPQPAGSACDSEVFLLPLGTLWGIANRKIKLPAWKHCEAFLRGCGITGERTLGHWQQAWKHAHADRAATAGESLQPRDPGRRARAATESMKPRDAGRRARAASRDTSKYSDFVRLVKAASAPPDADGASPTLTVRPLKPFSPRNDVLADLHKELFGSARRNGLVPDTEIDGIFIASDGSVQLVQAKFPSPPSSRSEARKRGRPKRRGRG
ncbi:helix-turn-helix transcriptional regulator [Streptomyces sp. ID05-04B]|uniref:helix-turn-helix domain-containing protein n=1 Tax=Streptomyces sp. ID05-04B TaxID=3028661 RepID=UPI0029C47D0E|nr:helix-turn-helix transcriptional regulator [Streptomyces sp. ID05-04B]MDX5570205.1 helix-turn-helix transcriptional regulator [Streptomyces sp. ID05-04B]